MRPSAKFVVTVAVLVSTTAAALALVPPPEAPRRPFETTIHGVTLVDPYAWLRNKQSTEVIEYLKAENAHAEASMAHTEDLQQALYDEMLGRLKQTDLSVPVKDGGYWYYSRTEEGKDYPIYCRREGTMDAPEEVYLDVNEEAKGYDYYRVTSRDISPDGRWLAINVDTSGAERVDLFVKDLQTGATRGPLAEGISPWTLAWANDNGKTLFFGRHDDSQRPNRIYRLDTANGEVELILQEDDLRFGIYGGRTKTDAYLVFQAGSKTTTQAWMIDARRPAGDPVELHPRVQGVDAGGFAHRPDPEAPGGHGWFYYTTDSDAPNYKLMRTPAAAPDVGKASSIIAHSRDVYLTGLEMFDEHMVLSERRGGYSTLRVVEHDTGKSYLIEKPEEVSSAWLGNNPSFDSDTVRFSYTSMITPSRVYDLNLHTGEKELLKETEVLGGYNPNDYVTKRLWAIADDGTRIPMSIVHRKGIVPNGDNPTLLYAYGSYGSSSNPSFRSSWVSYLDRGFVCAVAHVRGGSEMGRHWKEEGRMMQKINTFTDFIDCAEHLIDQNYTNPARLAIQGGSAGGLLVGAVVNMRPDLFRAAHAAVPFVDVINTMLDESIPLTTSEYEEWGNPNEPEAFAYMRRYSPYDNVKAQAYPDMLITAGLNDPRVAYWEPAKWTAKLRYERVGDNPLLLRTNMGAGHGGSSGRYGRYEEIAFEYAFLIDRVGAPLAPIAD